MVVFQQLLNIEDSERDDKKVLSNGDVYIGDFKRLIPHGKGKYTWRDKTVYEGDWEEGKMTGKGYISWSSGSKYEGDFSGGHLHGFGTFTGTDGSEYRGAWRMNIQQGLGRKRYSNSDIYEGSWKEGVHEGCGRYSWNSGNMYIGKWKGGKMCGRGVMKWANGDLFDGLWLNGLRHGSGVYRFADGGYYFGAWSRGLKDGKGTFYPAGTKLPSLRRWSSSLGYDDNGSSSLSHSLSLNSEQRRVSRRPSVVRSLSEKISISGMLRNSGRISNRSNSLHENWSPCDSARELICHEPSCSFPCATNEGQREVQGKSTVVYEREYMQGVLIKQRIKNAEPFRKIKQKNKFHTTEAKKKSCIDIFEGHQSYYLMLNLQLGIRYTVGKITPVPMRDVRHSDFEDRARIRMYFPRKGSQFTPPHYSIDFYWKDYCPMVFRNLREMFKLDAAEYMMSICGDDGLRELSSPGKSGSIFYLSHDDRFVIKTLKKSELKVRFVVMGNMFCTELSIHRRYDLKGSTQGRFTDKDKIGENTTLKDNDLKYDFHMDKMLQESLFKQLSEDCMFLQSQQIIDYSLLLGLHFRAPEQLMALSESAGAIANHENLPSGDGATSQRELLIPPTGLRLVTHEPGFNTAPGPHIRGNTLRAYSLGAKEVDLLLPGTGRLRVQLGVNMPAQASCKVGGEVDPTEVELFEVYDVVLYMGMIDILQEYNMRKKVEHTFKSLKFDPLSISAVEPELYADRFLKFLQKVFPEQP
ncbi:phosphatidylinositol 4-phosphate 5-kinase 8 isoform X2 [Manihot esculenta]|uniref:Phosphatidylinositol 4-phosphate 5-kinase n=1 Tax=Manihot esculenta TaxID=3983 RepID=A0A2C9VHL2_MANES|nr:phosphatidylinositol 4-phosphate 5-kinase 8 isoform X2 [Manihot esculenta]OAY44913.1 hypothetical protein MANES_07G015780v8 [Manihot esculenta]